MNEITAAIVAAVVACTLSPPDDDTKPSGWRDIKPSELAEIDVSITLIDHEGDPVVGVWVSMETLKSRWVDETDENGVAVGRVRVSPTINDALAVTLGGEISSGTRPAGARRPSLDSLLETNAVRSAYTFDVDAEPVAETIILEQVAIVSGSHPHGDALMFFAAPEYLGYFGRSTFLSGKLAIPVPRGVDVDIAFGNLGADGIRFVSVPGMETVDGSHSLGELTPDVHQVHPLRLRVSNVAYAYDPVRLVRYDNQVTLIDQDDMNQAFSFWVRQSELSAMARETIGVPAGDYFLCPGPAVSPACARLRAAMKAGLRNELEASGVLEISLPQAEGQELRVDFTPMTRAIYNITMP